MIDLLKQTTLALIVDRWRSRTDKPIRRDSGNRL